MCHALKDNSEYSKELKGKDGLKTYCKSCNNTRCRKYKQDNKDKIDATNSKYRQEQAEKIKLSRKSYRNSSKDKIKEYSLNQVSNLTDYYIKSKLKRSGFTENELNENPELIEVKRIIIKIKRT